MVARGEIWWADIPEPRGSEPGYRRPVLVVQSNAFNQSSIETVIVAIITSNMRLGLAPGNVNLTVQESGLPKDSVVNVSQILTLDRDELTERIGTLKTTTLQKIEDGLRQVMEL